jgi:hypothetical protein
MDLFFIVAIFREVVFDQNRFVFYGEGQFFRRVQGAIRRGECQR